MRTTTSCGAGSSEPEPGIDPDEPHRPHVVARAERTRAVHVHDQQRHTCGLCLHAWPCPPRAWADQALAQETTNCPLPSTTMPESVTR